jgi:uncharacterized cupredoxin-like copper-binding protein
MRHRLFIACLGVVCLTAVGWAATGPASGQVKTPSAHRSAKVTVVTVTVGKPSELAFKLSKFSQIPAGTITFKVKNVGLGFHNFKICTTPVLTSAKNACVGKVTPLLKRNQSATLTVILTKNGKYEYLCSVTGHAAAGMKGLLGVGVKVAAPAGGSVSGTTSGSSTSSGSTSSGSTSSGSTSSGSTSSGSTSSGSTTTSGGGGATVGECPAGMTIVQGAAANSDHDDDDTGGPTDGDGCL